MMTKYLSKDKIISLVCFFLSVNPYNHDSLGVGRVCAWTVSNIEVHKVPLKDRRETIGQSSSAAASPWCFAASSIVDLKPSDNFLATQVWPSARTAAMALQQHLDPKWKVCEFGCGPGLPSLTAARMGAEKVIATDLDKFALKLVQAAASEQQLDSILETRSFDLTTPIHNNQDQEDKTNMARSVKVLVPPKADLYILSDVFESSTVARGAAAWTKQLLNDGCRVWVFAQTDRAQREVFIDELRKIYDPGCNWSTPEQYTGTQQRLWLCEVDETAVSYRIGHGRISMVRLSSTLVAVAAVFSGAMGATPPCGVATRSYQMTATMFRR